MTKKLLMAGVLLLIVVLLAQPVWAQSARTVEMQVDGLVCAFCAQGINKKLRALPQTEDVLVSLEHHLVALTLKPETELSDESLRAALTESGYTVRGIQRTETSLEALRAQLATP